MKTSSIIAILSSLAFASATPLAKRVLVVETVIEEVTMTVDTTTTVWVKPSKETVAPKQNYQQPAPQHGHSHQYLHSHVPAASAYQAPAAQAPKAASAAPAYQAPKVAAPSPAVEAPKQAAPAVVAQASKPSTPTPVPAYTAPKQSPSEVKPAPVPAPAPAPAPAPKPAPVAPAAPVSDDSSYGSSSSGGSCGTVGGKCSGDVTYYEAGLGACGWTNDGNSEDVFALAHGMPLARASK